MTGDEHYSHAEDLAGRRDAAPLPLDQLMEAQVHASLALAASLRDIAAELSRFRGVVAELRW